MKDRTIILFFLGLVWPLAADEPIASCANHAVDICTNYLSGYSAQEAIASCKRWDSGIYSSALCSPLRVVGRCRTERQGQIIETLHYSITGRWTAERAGNACLRAGGQFSGE